MAVKVQPEPEPIFYKVQKGDTLEKIAANLYGNSREWRRIYNANRAKLKGPNRIVPGQELEIPPLPVQRTASGSDDTK